MNFVPLTHTSQYPRNKYISNGLFFAPFNSLWDHYIVISQHIATNFEFKTLVLIMTHHAITLPLTFPNVAMSSLPILLQYHQLSLDHDFSNVTIL